MEKRPDFRHGVLIAYGALAVLTGFLVAAPPEDSGEVAAWVQGIGTIAAVAVTGWVGLLPLRRQEQQAWAERNSFLRALNHGLRMVARECLAALVALKEDDLPTVAAKFRLLALFAETGIMTMALADRRPDWPTEDDRLSVWMVALEVEELNRLRTKKAFVDRLKDDPIAFRADALARMERLLKQLDALKHYRQIPPEPPR